MRRIVAAPLEAQLTVAIADDALEEAVASKIQAALRFTPPPRAKVVRLRTRSRLASKVDRLAGAFVVVRVTAANARHLVAMVDAIRQANAAGVQLVWDGESPGRARAQRHVFAVLEHVRATPNAAPVVLAPTDELALSLRLIADARGGENKMGGALRSGGKEAR